MTQEIMIQGIHCPSCKLLIEDVCSEFPEIKSCTVDYMTGKAVIDYDASLDWQKLKTHIEGLGRYTFQIPAMSA